MSTHHFTTRRGFIAAMGFGGVSLYGLWAAYGAAPGPLALFGGGHGESDAAHGSDSDAPMAHGGGHGAAAGPSAEEFRRLTTAFVARYAMPDGSVYPRRLDPSGQTAAHDQPDATAMPAMAHDQHSAAMPAMAHDQHDSAAMPMMAHDQHGAVAMPMDVSDHAAVGDHGDAHADDAGHGDGGVIDVYFLAEKWYYEPAHLRLDAGTTYRFRMMATDVSHGASIQFGRGGRMIRLRPNAVAEMQAVFPRPGTYLVYCTVYCGQAHDLMQARIEVV